MSLPGSRFSAAMSSRLRRKRVDAQAAEVMVFDNT
ncbi:hypothetical protein X764_21775 [Mesorhizobium sp. LSHC440A00]|nr:hypothetical protein X764_21775 [Mesorhizobium sp. LSHC440A00]